MGMGEGLSSADKGILQMLTSALFGAKTGFFEIYGSSTRSRGGVSQCGHLADKEGGVNFSRFCVYVFYGRSNQSFRCLK